MTSPTDAVGTTPASVELPPTISIDLTAIVRTQLLATTPSQ
ncbi:hypothetical protein [Humibacter sp.]